MGTHSIMWSIVENFLLILSTAFSTVTPPSEAALGAPGLSVTVRGGGNGVGPPARAARDEAARDGRLEADGGGAGRFRPLRPPGSWLIPLPQKEGGGLRRAPHPTPTQPRAGPKSPFGPNMKRHMPSREK
jgi:hypothetical protein